MNDENNRRPDGQSSCCLLLVAAGMNRSKYHKIHQHYYNASNAGVRINSTADAPTEPVRRSHSSRIAGASQPCLQTLDAILALGERASFAPQHGENQQEIKANAGQLLSDLDSLSWQRKPKDILGDLQS